MVQWMATQSADVFVLAQNTCGADPLFQFDVNLVLGIAAIGFLDGRCGQTIVPLQQGAELLPTSREGGGGAGSLFAPPGQ